MTLTAPVETAVGDAYKPGVSMMIHIVLHVAALPLLLKALEEVHGVGEGQRLRHPLRQIVLIHDVAILKDREEGQGGTSQ